MDRQPPYYLQTDAKWRDIDYSAKGENTTIGKAGCGPTACAMAISAITGREVLPPEVAAWLLTHGYKAKNQGTYYAGIAAVLKQYGISSRQITSASVYHSPKAAAHAKAVKALQEGNLVIACMGKGIWTSSGHFVLAWKVDGTKAYINDPNSLKAMRMCNLIATWQNEVKQYWVVDVNGYAAKPEPEEISGAKTIAEVDDEVIENKFMKIMGTEFAIPNIFKENRNFASVRALCDAIGLKVTSEGNKPVVDMDAVRVKKGGETHVIPGINVNGTVYLPVRRIASLLDVGVDWQNGAVILDGAGETV